MIRCIGADTTVGSSRSAALVGGAFSAFGLEITSPLPLPGRWRAAGGGGATLRLILVEPADVRSRWSGCAQAGWSGRTDGRQFTAEHGLEGDLRMELDGIAEFHLSSDRSVLAAAGDAAAPAFMRALLDSVLFTVALQCGYEALHAGAVEVDGSVIAVAGPSGAGKSSLVAALLESGARFFSDDVVVLGRGDGLTAHPGPPVMTAPSGCAPAGGEEICSLGDESWLAVDGALAPAPLACVVILDPRPAVADDDATALLALAPHVIAFPRTPARARARFEVASELAAGLPLVAVEPRSDSPLALADRVLSVVDRKETVT